MKTAEQNLTALQDDLVGRCREGIGESFEIATYNCGDKKTLRPLGSTRVNDLANISNDEFLALLGSWAERAITMMTTFCNLAAPEGCRDIEIVDFTNYELTARPSTDGQPPFTVFLEADITFRCIRRI